MKNRIAFVSALVLMMLVVLAQSGLAQSQHGTTASIPIPRQASALPLFRVTSPIAGSVVANDPASSCGARTCCPGCKTIVTIPCTGGACKPGAGLQVNTIPAPLNSTQSAPVDAAPPAAAANDAKEQPKPAAPVTSWVHFANAPVNSAFYFVQGAAQELWLKTSTNIASHLVSGQAIQVPDDAAITVVSQGIGFDKVPLNSTFYFLLDAQRSRPWIKASSTTAANPRDGKEYPIRSGLVALATLP